MTITIFAIHSTNVSHRSRDDSEGRYSLIEMVHPPHIGGEASYSWIAGHNDAIGRYKVVVQVSASGYENHTASKSFKVNSIPVS